MTLPLSTADRVSLQASEQARATLERMQSAVKAPGSMLPEIGGSRVQIIEGHRQNLPARGTQELLTAYSESPWVRAVFGRVAHATASVEWKVFRTKGRTARAAAVRLRRMKDIARRREALRAMRKAKELEEVEEHPLLTFLEAGNPIHSGLKVRTVTQLQRDLVGEGFSLLDLNGLGQPMARWVVPPTWVRKIPVPGRDATFTLRAPGTAKDVDVPARFMLWASELDPANPYGRGSGLGRALSDEIDTDEFAAQHTKQVFANHARPDLLVSIDGVAQPQLDEFKERWAADLQGWLKSQSKPYFVNRKTEVHELTRTMVDLQMVELRRWERDIIVHVIGVPPEILGILESSNRATIDSADFIFSKWVLVPRLEGERDLYQTQLVPLYEDAEGLVIDYESPVQLDKEHARAVMASHPYAFMVDETRVAAGLEELPDGRGQVFPQPFGVEGTEEPLAIEAIGPEPAPEPEPEEPDKAVRATKTVGEEDINRILAAIESGAISTALEPVLRDVVQNFGAAMLREMGNDTVSFNLSDPRIVHFLRGRALERAKRINLTTREKVRAQLIRGVRAGEGTEAIARRVSSVFEASRGARSITIARTEVARASNHGGLEGMRQGGATRKQWLCVDGSTLLTGPGVQQIARRWHDGTWATLRTLSGRVVTVTADHKMLTDRGWLAAQEIKQGDYVVSYEISIENAAPASGVVPDVEHQPATVAEVFDAALEWATAAGMVSRVVHLDSEGRQCEVDVVPIDSELRARLQPAGAEGRLEELLELSDIALSRLLRDGASSHGMCVDPLPNACASQFAEMLQTPAAHADRLMRDTDQTGLGARSDVDSGVAQASCDHPLRGSEIPRERHQGLTADIAFSYDRCVSIEITSGRRHAYDYTTATGWMIANGLVVHNSTRDNLVRDTHAPGAGLDMQIQELDQDFVSPSTGATGPYPGEMSLPEESIRCRCDLLPVLDERTYTDQQKNVVWKRREARRRPYEGLLRRRIRRAFSEQEEAALKEVRKGRA